MSHGNLKIFKTRDADGSQTFESGLVTVSMARCSAIYKCMSHPTNHLRAKITDTTTTTPLAQQVALSSRMPRQSSMRWTTSISASGGKAIQAIAAQNKKVTRSMNAHNLSTLMFMISSLRPCVPMPLGEALCIRFAFTLLVHNSSTHSSLFRVSSDT